MSGRRLVFILVLLGVVLIACGNSSEITKGTQKKPTIIDKCENANPPCEVKKDCSIKSSGQYRCSCDDGFKHHAYDDLKCVDDNECRKDKCRGYDVCTNTNGSYICSCKEGYYKKGDGCQDINECNTGAHKCDTKTSKCANTVGGHLCECLKGFKKKQDKCADIDECRETPKICVDESATCKNTIGSYKCICKNSGYKYDRESNSCSDINECKEKLCGTDKNMECQNSQGSYSCECKPHYRKDGNTCKDVDECKENKHNCSKQTHCHNTHGGFRCVCPKGHILQKDGVTCLLKHIPKSASSKPSKAGSVVLYSLISVAVIGLLAFFIFLDWKLNAGKVKEASQGIANLTAKQSPKQDVEAVISQK